jgi:hypothetical protein
MYDSSKEMTFVEIVVKGVPLLVLGIIQFFLVHLFLLMFFSGITVVENFFQHTNKPTAIEKVIHYK